MPLTSNSSPSSCESHGHRRLPRAYPGRFGCLGDKSISHRYALLAALADGRIDASATTRPAATVPRRLPVSRALGRRRSRVRGPSRDDRRRDRGSRPAAGSRRAGDAARLRQLRQHDAHAGRRRRRASVHDHADRRSLALAAADAPHHRARSRAWARASKPPTGTARRCTIHGADLDGIDFVPEVPSAQVKSAVLLAGLQATGRSRVTEHTPTQGSYGARARGVRRRRSSATGRRVAVEGGQRLRGLEARVPGRHLVGGLSRGGGRRAPRFRRDHRRASASIRRARPSSTCCAASARRVDAEPTDDWQGRTGRAHPRSRAASRLRGRSGRARARPEIVPVDHRRAARCSARWPRRAANCA